jgi:hypothetical protein
MPYFPVPSSRVTITDINKWIDIDLNAHATLPSTGVTGVALRIAGSASFGFRAKGSTMTMTSTVSTRCFGGWAGVDANDKFQIYSSSKTAIRVYVVGYMTAGFTFFASAIAMSTSTLNTWEEVDCTAHVPAAATALIFQPRNISSNDYNFGIRDAGSTDDLRPEITRMTCGTAITKCTACKCEQYIENAYVDLYLVGYVTGESLGTFFRDKAGNDYSLGGAGAYTDLTALPVGARVGIFEVMDDGTSTAYSYALRKNGEALDEYLDNQHCFVTVEADINGVVEGKVENLITNFYLIGWFAGNNQMPHCNVGMGDYQVI